MDPADDVSEPDIVLDEPWGALAPFATAVEPLAESRFARLDLGFADRYEPKGTLHRTRHSEVRTCRDLPFAREIVMKVLLVERSNHTLRWRFLREARVQGQLAHVGVVPVHDLGLTPDGDLYFTMDRLHGHALTALLRAGTPAATEALSALRGVAKTVAYAHRRGVLHRDLKPNNVVIDTVRGPFVLDWGLAKLRAGGEDPLADASAANETHDGTVLGSLGYIAPEQLRGETEVDARADIYSLGAMLFEALAGEALHSGTPTQRTLSALQLDGARPSQRRPDLDIEPALDDACFEATRQAPGDRLASAEAIAQLLS